MFLRRYLYEMYAWKVNTNVNPKVIRVEQNLHNWDLFGEVWIPHGFLVKEYYALEL